MKIRRKHKLTFNRANEVFIYNPKTGLIRWKVDIGFRIKCGQEAGGIHTKGYRVITIDGVEYKAHHIAWLLHYGMFPIHGIDHKDGDGLNNRIKNLRDVPQSVNGKNQRLKKNNKSGVSGVFWSADRKMWRVSIGHGRRKINLGQFSSFSKAISIRKMAEKVYGYYHNHGNKRAK